MPANAETQGRAFNPESDGTSEDEGGNEEVQALTQVQPGQELGEDEAEGGGEEGALMSNGAVRHNIVDDADAIAQLGAFAATGSRFETIFLMFHVFTEVPSVLSL